MAKLKPCPFCGGTDILEYVHDDQYTVECYECSANIPSFNGKADAIKAWNKRVKEGK